MLKFFLNKIHNLFIGKLFKYTIRTQQNKFNIFPLIPKEIWFTDNDLVFGLRFFDMKISKGPCY